MLDATQPKGAHYYWKTEFLAEVNDDFVGAFLANAEGIESPMSQMMMFHIAGAVNEHAEDEELSATETPHLSLPRQEPGPRPIRTGRRTSTGFALRGSGSGRSPPEAITSTSRRPTTMYSRIQLVPGQLRTAAEGQGGSTTPITCSGSDRGIRQPAEHQVSSIPSTGNMLADVGAAHRDLLTRSAQREVIVAIGPVGDEASIRELLMTMSGWGWP